MPGYEASAFLLHHTRPRRRPPEINRAAQQGDQCDSRRARAKARFAELGRHSGFPAAPANFGKLIADETEKWAKVIKFAGIKAN